MKLRQKDVSRLKSQLDWRGLFFWKRDLDSAAFRTWDELQLRGICGSAAEKEDLVPTSRVK